MSPFIKLADPVTHASCTWDLCADAEGRLYWAEFFKRHLSTILALGIESSLARGAGDAEVRGRADACRRQVYARFDAFMAEPVAHAPVTILTLDAWRDGLLREFGFIDPFIDLKNRENEKMLPLLAPLCRELDSLPENIQPLSLIEGIFAGNIFDMGAEATAKAFLAESPSFHAIRSRLRARPWLIDDADVLIGRLLHHRYRKVIFFIDNAGSDFLLGALPMARWLAQRGTRVIIAANERPTLNDMTIHDIRAWWPRILAAEPSLGSLPIDLISTGTGEPLIDLCAVSDALNAAATDTDLVILEGMGRGVESNLDARFTCDALNIAMLKDPIVAHRVGGNIYDLVCRFRLS